MKKLIYIGNAYIPGVKAQNIEVSDEEAKALIASGLYEEEKKKPTHKEGDK